MRVGVIGCGYWGQKLARVLHQLGALEALCDTDRSKLEELGKQYAGSLHGSGKPVLCLWNEEDLINSVDAVAIATPPDTHFYLARTALRAGKHVFVEKPITTDLKQAEHLESLAKRLVLNLRVGHIYLHCPGLAAMPKPVGQAELYVKLLNVAGSPSDSTRELKWAGLPHAVSVALHFFPDWPCDISVLREENRLKVKLGYWDGSVAFLDVGDFVGVRMRNVELRVGTRRYHFDADRPYLFWELAGSLHQWGSGPVLDSPDPLTLELKNFLEKEGVDIMGSKVVKLIEEIMGK